MAIEIISHYRIERKLGAGGMGEVYLARDSALDRLVALKILPAEFVSDPDRLHRFIREAKAASAVNHPNVAHIYEIGEEKGTHFIAMEFVEGESLAARMQRTPIASTEVVNIALQTMEALGEAHEKGVIHRDIKPQNIMISASGRVKLVDFGLARIEHGEQSMTSFLSTASQTELGTVIGTLPYMSPEQLLGQKVDRRSDFFSFGIVLYQMATRELPFQGNTAPELADAILHRTPESVHDLNQEFPAALAKTISKMLSKEPAERHDNAGEILAELKRLPIQKESPSFSALIHKPLVMVPVVLILLGLIASVFWFMNRNAKIRWGREEALPQMTRLADEGKFKEAVQIGTEAERYIPDDAILKTLWVQISSLFTIHTDPPNADVFFKEYNSTNENWKLAGKTPIEKLRLPKGYYRLKIVKPGFPEILTVLPRGYWEQQQVTASYSLEKYKDNPGGMVRIPGNRTDSFGGVDLDVKLVDDDFWMDQHEVSNKDFEKFVENGGYQNKKYWKVPFMMDGRTLSFEEAMTHFRDAAGRPGPMEWEVGQFPQDQGDYPVTGISWYEAAAYSEFAGKSLPTIYHWYLASGGGINFMLIPVSNFGGRGPHPVGNSKAMGPYGTVDMAGNVSEWCWNESVHGTRYILGGSYADPVYMFTELNQRPAFFRDKTIGFRTVKYLPETSLSTYVGPYAEVMRDYKNEKPVDDKVFAALKTLYDYEKKDLNTKKESAEDQGSAIKEKVTFNAAYGNERMIAYVFLPKNISPPYQAIVYFPGSGAQFFSDSGSWMARGFAQYGDFLIRSGRAFVYPVYKGTFERGGGPGSEEMSGDQEREWRVQYVKDFRRTMDYLETRGDIDMNKVGYFGSSWGGRVGSIIGAVEDRVHLMILEHGGFPSGPHPMEQDEINFAPHVHVPVLMINGSFDHVFPPETSQKPMFAALGTVQNDKMHFVFPGGHTTPRKEIIKVVLDWLDKYFGPPKLNN